ncbi:MAG: hypothetical protein LAQ69_31230 [Acidobacteriia bacterium]|nr:hypothetical protein [Terriglobia bacterium]
MQKDDEGDTWSGLPACHVGIYAGILPPPQTRRAVSTRSGSWTVSTVLALSPAGRIRTALAPADEKFRRNRPYQRYVPMEAAKNWIVLYQHADILVRAAEGVSKLRIFVEAPPGRQPRHA